jgi:hypothetical protein
VLRIPLPRMRALGVSCLHPICVIQPPEGRRSRRAPAGKGLSMPVDGFFGTSAGSLVRGEAVGAEPAEFLDLITLSYIWPLRSGGSGRGRCGVVIGFA